MMSSKLLSYKIKWIITGLFSGIFITIFVPEFLLTNKMKNQEKNDLITKTQYTFAEYSKWPLFLTDSSFDLV